MIKMMPGKIAVRASGKTNNKNSSFMITPDSNVKMRGEVAHVAEDVDLVKVGQSVYFHKERIELTIEGVLHYVMNVDNVLAIDE